LRVIKGAVPNSRKILRRGGRVSSPDGLSRAKRKAGKRAKGGGGTLKSRDGRERAGSHPLGTAEGDEKKVWKYGREYQSDWGRSQVSEGKRGRRRGRGQKLSGNKKLL